MSAANSDKKLPGDTLVITSLRIIRDPRQIPEGPLRAWGGLENRCLVIPLVETYLTDSCSPIE